jgi:predicted dehydrogenase
MKQVFGRKGNVVVEEVPAPVCEDNGVIVANHYSLISTGTEREALRKRESLLKLALQRPDLVKKVWKYFKKQGLLKTRELIKSKMLDLIPLGYSSAGIITEVGENVAEFKVGDRVACAGAGYATHSEYAYVPKNLMVKIPDNVSFEEAAFAAVGSIAVQGVRRSDVKIGENVAVIGLGLIGLLTVQILKAAGCNVIGGDINKGKVDIAKKLGIDKGIVIDQQDFSKDVEKFTNGVGVDAVIITASSKTNQPILQALEICRKKGKIVVVGDIPLELPRELFYKKELDFLISTSYGPGRYDKSYEEKGIDYPIAYVRWTEKRNMEAFLRLLEKRKIDVKPLISDVFNVEDAAKAYEKILNGNKIGILLKYKPSLKEVKRKLELPSKPKKGKINVALIGAGNFAKSYHLPNLKRIKDYNIYAIVDHNPANAKKVAEQYGAKFFATDYKSVLKDKNVDLVVITTRHDSHAKITIDTAKAGKDILVEKPMAMNEQELTNVVNTLLKSKVNFMVGFNRRFSPLTIKAKELLNEKEGPIIINYTVNAGKLPLDSWIYDPKEGGGRIIGECCHFFDLFNFFISSDVESLTATSTTSNIPDIKSEDNIVATIKYKDGSIATLTYNSIGSEELSKERIEIMREGCTLIIDDFKELKSYGFGNGMKLIRQDKGHFNELVEFAKIIRGEQAQTVSLEDCIKATKLSFDVAKKLNK